MKSFEENITEASETLKKALSAYTDEYKLKLLIEDTISNSFVFNISLLSLGFIEKSSIEYFLKYEFLNFIL